MHVEVNGKTIAGSPFSVRAFVPQTFRYQGPPCYDNCGLFYWLGTGRAAPGKNSWRNPVDLGVVRVTISSRGNLQVNYYYGSNDTGLGLNRLVDSNSSRQGQYGDPLCTDHVPNSWMMVELLGGVRVRPTGYVFSTGGQGNYQPRHWELQGSMDGHSWTTLRKHTNDDTMTQQTSSSSAYWEIEYDSESQSEASNADSSLALSGADAYYTHVRLLQTGKNSSNTDHFCAHGLEVYGDVIIVPSA